MTKFREKFEVKYLDQIELKVETEAGEIRERWHHELSD